MQHRSTIVVIAGGVVVLGSLFGLQQWLASSTEPIVVEPSALAPTEAAEPTPTPTGLAAPRSVALPVPTRAVPSPRNRDPGPSLTPSADTVSGPEPGSPENTKNLHFGKPALREQIAAVRPQLDECAQRAARAGHRLTGDAALTFIVAMKGDQAVVEATGVDHDETTLDQAELLECMQETARAMKFEGLPREARAISVRRRVGVKDGELVENELTDFSYIR